jgi:pimeloyl-ACP methyl ester carboxylesterase
MKGSSLLSFVAVTGLSISAFAQECRLDYGQEDLNELRLSDDYRLAYLEYGSGEPVVLIHGALSDYRVWLHQVEDLRRDYRVIAPSLRASFPNSLSRSPNTPAAETWSDADDVIELIEHLAVGRVHLIGHSGGGAIALDIAVRRPDLLRSLILEEPAVGTGEPPPEVQSLFASVIEQIGRGETKAAVRDFMNFVSGPGYFDSQSAECQQMLTENAATISITALGQVLPDTTCATAGTVQAPVLYIQGEISPLRDSPFKECLPPHESVTITNASHGVHADNPRQFNEAVRDFVGRH